MGGQIGQLVPSRFKPLLFTTVIIASLLATAGPAGVALAQEATVCGSGAASLLTNPGAEDGPGSTANSQVTPIPGWVTTSNFTAFDYVASGEAANASEPINGGANFFVGGPDNALSTATQTVDVSARAADIDAGGLEAELAAFIGGFETQEDNGMIDAAFLGASGNALGTITIGPVTAAERNYDSATLLCRETTGEVPIGTRSVTVTLTSTRAAGAYNDGTFDNIGFSISSVIRGTESDDTITGTSGDDIIFAAGGNDTIDGGGGNDTIYGELGNDIIVGGLGDDIAFGGDGNDTISDCDANGCGGIHGNDTLDGGIGDDRLTFDAVSECEVPCGIHGEILGGAGNDTLDVTGIDDLLNGGPGTDTITYDAVSEDQGTGGICCRGLVEGGGGNDSIDTSGPTLVKGGGGGDTISEDDPGPGFSCCRGKVLGGGGNDDITGLGGDDILSGGAGADVIDDGCNPSGDGCNPSGDCSPSGDCTPSGRLLGGGGNDTITSGPGVSETLGGPGDDTISDEGPKVDTNCCRGKILGGAGNDTITDSGDKNLINGGTGNDTLTGALGKDKLLGGDGNDVIFAKDGSPDVINGGPGADKAQIDKGLDVVSGIERFI